MKKSELNMEFIKQSFENFEKDPEYEHYVKIMNELKNR